MDPWSEPVCIKDPVTALYTFQSDLPEKIVNPALWAEWPFPVIGHSMFLQDVSPSLASHE